MAPLTGARVIGKLLIANRGEIACRIARTAHRMGIGTVGVYAEPDRNALHVDAVDVAVAVPSYLDAEAIIAAARRAGADAVHPGYGFLAENAAFAEAVAAAGLTWVGPTPEQIRLLGDKIAAKQAAIDAGVPTTPIVTIDGGAMPAASELPPFPLLVKAAAGGGGRGMRVVASADELDAAVVSASREAESAFGDGTVFIEPFIARGRHVEVQVFGDAHGNVVHLGERECSIQRRNQKIVEESPSPGITSDIRDTLHAGAVALAKHVGYVGAGTVEYMVGEAADASPQITFLEVNTRLQVEHPVTEAVTGLDLVEWQLRVAAGEPLPLTQDDITFTGAAIEVRLVAEDPAADWLPSVGGLTQFEIGGADDAGRVRLDTGFRAGSTVAAEYDSMLAKVIVHDADRAVAAMRLARALRGACVTGVRTNAHTLAAILTEPDFLAGKTPTAYLAEHPDVLAPAGMADADEIAHLVAAVLASEQAHQASNPLAFAPSGWRNLRTRGQRRTRVIDAGPERHVEYVFRRDGTTVDVLVGPPPVADADGALPADERRAAVVRLLDRQAGRVAIELDGVRQTIDVTLAGDETTPTTVTHSPAGTLVWTTPPRFVDHDLEAEGGGPHSPLPGTVIAVHVEAGQHVAEGDLLMVVEAMKMEHRITAAAAGVVTEVRFATGDRVDQGDLLVALDVHEVSDTS
jgi:propionyl-CoA carboxylase alpha chain